MTLAAMTASARAQEAEPPALDQYEPEYFSASEWAFVMAATARIIPSEGDGPGAIETRVPVFIDRQLAGPFGKAADWYMEGPHDPAADAFLGFQSPLTPAEIYRGAIERVDAACEERFGAVFAELNPEQQDEVLTILEQGEEADEPDGGAASGSTEEVAESSSGGAAQTDPDTQTNGATDETAGSSAGAATAGSGGFGLAPELREFFAILVQNTKEGFFADPRHGGNHQMQGWLHVGFPGARASYLEWVDKHNVAYPLGPVSISGERA